MCDICGSMLRAEHTEQPGAELCPKCHRFPLDAEFPYDPSEWDYVAPELQNAEPFAPAPPDLVDPIADLEPETAVPEEGEEETEEEHVRTCYHCYQADSGLAEPCPVCGDSYLPPSLRKPHRA